MTSVALVVHRYCSKLRNRNDVYGGVKSIIGRNISLFPWLTRSQVYYTVNKIKRDAVDSISEVSHADSGLVNELVITNFSYIASTSSTTIELNSTDIVEFKPASKPASISTSGRLKGGTTNERIDAARRKKGATDIMLFVMQK